MTNRTPASTGTDNGNRPRRLLAAVDIGGTFTDAVTYDPDTGEISTGKSLTTHGALEQGVCSALQSVGYSRETSLRDLRHGSTIVINALIERKAERTALVTTHGFEQVLFIGRANVPVPYSLNYRRLPPYIEPTDAFGVGERTDADGKVLARPDENEIRTLAEKLRAAGYRAVGIAFLNSYQNPSNEQWVAEQLRALLTDVYITCSTDVSREWHEWSRTSTAVMNAYVGPVVRSYLQRVADKLAVIGTVDRILASDSTGGLMSIDRAQLCPIYMVESGPASGAMAAVQVARECGFDRILTFDMGGTTAKSALSVDGLLATVPLYWVNGYHRGWPVQCHSIDIIEIGAGGGSIAWRDEVGALHVGPRSSGSDPGPACYARGGSEPTITDAHVHLGHIPPTYWGTEIALDPKLATMAIAGLADKLGISAGNLANGILDIANNHMAAMLRTLTARRGYDPRDFTLVAFGGSGPLHASPLARELKIRKILVPARAGVFSAFGMLLSDLRVDAAAVSTETLQSDSLERMGVLWGQLREQLDSELAQVGEPDSAIRYLRSFDGRYRGQDHVINVPISDSIRTSVELRAEFDAAYRQRYGHHDALSNVQFTVIRLSAFKEVDKPQRMHHRSSTVLSANDGGAHLLRSQLKPGDRIKGPRIILEEGATIMLNDGDTGLVLPSGDLLIEVEF